MRRFDCRRCAAGRRRGGSVGRWQASVALHMNQALDEVRAEESPPHEARRPAAGLKEVALAVAQTRTESYQRPALPGYATFFASN